MIFMILIRFLIGYTVTHYGLSTVWANRTGVLIASAIMGVLSVIFFNL